MFANAALPPCLPGGSTTDLESSISDWVRSDALAALVNAFGGDPFGGDPTGTHAPAAPTDTGARLAALDLFSAQVWDFRQGGERVEATDPTFSAEIDALVAAAAPALGLAARTRPAWDSYQHVLILGGGLASCLARARLAADLISAGVTTTSVSGLGSLRPLAKSHPDLPYRPTEGDAMLVAARRTFAPDAEFTYRRGSVAPDEPWWVRTATGSSPTLHVLAAPKAPQRKRANTADTLVGWTTLVTRPEPTDRILVVTTDLYVPFQHSDAIRIIGLPYRCGIDTLGLNTIRPNPSGAETAGLEMAGAGTAGADGVPRSTTAKILQEVRSAIQSVRALHATLSRTE